MNQNEKGETQMNKKRLTKVTHRVIVALVAVTLLFCAVWSGPAEASAYKAAYIERNDNLNVNYKDYLNGSVVQKLPDAVKDDQVISVIITLDIVNLMDAYEKTDKTMSFRDYALFSEDAKNVEAQVLSQREDFLKVLDEKEIEYKVTGLTYSTLLTGFELQITARDFDSVCGNLSTGMDIMVSESYKVATTVPVSNTVNVHSTGIINADGLGYDGSGLVVAVLDTGLDYAHSAFDESRFTSTNLGLTYDQVAALLGETMASKQYEGLSVDDVFISNKVPFGFDYADQNPDVYSTHNNHGTHVSGIIVGNDDTIRGVAPNAQLVSMKVFSDVYDSAISSWILSALEDCVILGVDVINMSLGTAAGFSREGDEEKMWGVYDKIRDAGISLMVAASNSYSSAFGSAANGNLGLTSNPDTATVGSPGTYKGAMSVASISGTLTPYLLIGETIVYFDEANNNAGKEQKFCEKLLGGEETKTLEYVVIPGVGRSADYTGQDVTGKIALVSRGGNTFEEKALIAQQQGAAGIIIYNNVSGDIKMNIGDATLAVCSISKDNGKMLVEAAGESGIGKLVIGEKQAAGPFISDFSSWGPTPDLGIKPEITGEGGNILSAVTGGGYDRLSGTSMATPNLAGVALLMRQYIIEKFPEIANDPNAINSLLYRLMMSTADIVLNENGLPYAVRKQGAGLANLRDALSSPAVITTYDANGNAMDKTKLELGDDAAKKGVYTMTFTVENFGSASLSYDIGAYVLTEGVSETLTNAGLTTVTEQAYALAAALTIDSVKGGTLSGNNLTIAAKSQATVTVTITLTDEDKAYLDKSFENGMYVEGFITLKPTAGTEVDMSVPYLAFYGDWNEAPIFDKDYFETNKDELDDGIDEEDKIKADAYATTPIGGIENDYVSFLGAYYFEQNPADRVISASRDYIALSNQNGTIHSLRFVWAGLLRGCAKIEITITDDSTGEVIFETADYDVRKSYGDGGSIYPANIEIEFDTMDYNLMNNSEYTVKITGYTDFGDGGITTNDKNTFEFPLVVDFEAPTVNDVEFRYVYDKTLKKNRLYADIKVYDNHYTMAMQVGYVGTTIDPESGSSVAEIKTFSQYMTPVYSQKNSTTTVTYELTDYIYQIKAGAYNANTFVVTAYDYALNYATYEIGLPVNYVDFYMDGLDDGLTLSPNEVYDLSPAVYPNTEWAELLEFTSRNTKVVRVVNNKLVAVGPGTAVVTIRDPGTNKKVNVTVKVLNEGDEGYVRYDKPVADVFNLVGYYVKNAHFLVSSTDREIGSTGDTRYFEGGYYLSMYPAESVILNYRLDAYFPNDVKVTYTSGNPKVAKVDEYGTITAVSEGNANIIVNLVWKENGKSTNYSATVKVSVKDPFMAANGNLQSYHGEGGIVTIPKDLSITTIASFAFSGFDYVLKTDEEYAVDDSSLSKQAPLGNNTITKVVIPEGVETIGSYAFAYLTALEEVVMPSTLKYIEYGAFTGCSNLKKLTFSNGNGIVTINQFAFEGCNLTGTLDLPSAYVISDNAFAGNTKLEVVNLPKTLMTIGANAFAGCSSLKEVNISADKVKFGEYAFTNCTSLTAFNLKTSVVPTGMFYGCKNLSDVTIGKDVNAIYEYAFRNTAVEIFKIEKGNTAFQVKNDSYILSADGSQLVAVAPGIRGEFTAANIGNANVTTVGRGAFSHNTRITSVTLDQVTSVSAYAFAVEVPEYSQYGSLVAIRPGNLKNVKLGELTYIGEYGFCGVAMTELPAISASAQIGKFAFSYSGLTKVVIPNGMTVSEGMFVDCASLKEVIIGDDVIIGKNAFGNTRDFVGTVKYYQQGFTYLFYYELASSLKSLTIGNNVTIGDNAFVNCASLESVTLGENAKIGYMAFYNNASLKDIDLSKASYIGDYAFSGDVYYICADSSMSTPAVSNQGMYMYTYMAPDLTQVDLSAVEKLGAYAFAYCTSLKDVVLGEKITEIGEYTFASCFALENIDLSKVVSIGDYAMLETNLKKVDLASAQNIGKYVFANCKQLDDVTLSGNGSVIGEGAFAECAKLAEVKNLQYATEIGAYAFANTAITNMDLSAAVSIGDFAFTKQELTSVTVKLGDALVSLGDNPFALCKVAPFSSVTVETFNGVDYQIPTYTYDISETVKVIDGSLYCVVPNGLELITYTNRNPENVAIAEGTVRITGLAFAGSDVKMVTLPHTVATIGHKAFYLCKDLKVVTFTSYQAPILEEAFDSSYYDSLKHVPGSGDYGTYTDYDGTEVTIEPIGMIPYFMWNATGGMYSNVFYGANFVDYIGYVDNKILMIRPSNGKGYETYILGQYFDMEMVVNGATAADDNTLAFMAAIQLLPERVTYADKALVENARALYNKIVGLDQQALATAGYSTLLTAEQRIRTLTPVDEKTQAFIDAVAALPEQITLENEAQILAARELYAAITDSVQLTKAEDALKKLVAAEESLAQLKEAAKKQNSTTITIIAVSVIVVLGAVVLLLQLKRKSAEKKVAVAQEATEDQTEEVETAEEVTAEAETAEATEE